MFSSIIRNFQVGFRQLALALAPVGNEQSVSSMPAAFPDGHYYSPVVDIRELATRADQIWPARTEILGIDFNDGSHREILQSVFPKFIQDYDYPEHGEESDTLSSFFTHNTQFSWLDARALFVLIRHFCPRRIIEVGSGFSSLLLADINRRFLSQQVDITCIEPYPRPFLRAGFPGISRLVERKVQDVPLTRFSELEAGDVLFIDSSHVTKTGSDVNFLYFEVLPRLAKGVKIHIHDIFLPDDYPRAWVLEENRSWNEQYLLRAHLMFSSAFRVVFGSAYAFARFPDLVRDALALPSGAAFGGGSFWLEKTA